MRNDDYWRERMKMLEDALLDDSYKTVKNIEEQFARANRSIEADLARWYQRFADNNEITLAEARKLLTSDELAEFKWTVQDYIRHGQSLDKAWAKQLENASARVHISRLDSLKIQLQQHAEELAGKTLAGAENTIKGTYRESYYHTAFEFQKGIGLGWSLQSINKAQIDKVLSKPWSTDMKTFRDRCWTNKEALVNSVNKELTQMIMRGESPDRAIKAIQKQFNVAKNKAGRLIMTESAAFAATARQDCFESLGIEQYVIVGTLDNETCSLCGSLDGKHFKMSEYQVGTTAPPFHPWCRCCTAPYYDDWDEFDVDTYRAARDDEGEYYEVPRDMTYKTWKEKALKNSGLTNSSESAIIYKEPQVGYRDYETAEKLLAKDATTWQAEISANSKDSIVSYTDDIYLDLNDWLRNGMEYDDDLFETLTADIDAGISDFNLSQAISVIRGTSTEILRGHDLSSIIGETLWDPGYLSTTIEKSIAADFADMAVKNSGGKRLFLQFDIPAGKGRGAFVDGISSHPGELEFLVKRDAEFEVYALEEFEGDMLLKARWKE